MQKWRRYLFLTWVNGGIFTLIGIPAVFKFSFFWPLEFLAAIITAFSLLGWGILKLWFNLDASFSTNSYQTTAAPADQAATVNPSPTIKAAGPVITPSTAGSTATSQTIAPTTTTSKPPAAGAA